MISAKSTQDLALIKRTSRFQMNHKHTLTIVFNRSHRIQMIDSIQIEFVVPSGNSLQTTISIVKIPNFSSVIQTKCIIHVFPALQRRESTPYESTNDHVYNSANGTPFQMISRRIQHEPTLTLQLTGTPAQMSSRRSNQI